MKNLLILVTLLIGITMFSQTTCSSAEIICSDSSISFNNIFNGTNAQVGPHYGCLTTQENATWHFINVERAGNITINISQEDLSGSPIDVNFITYGPFLNFSTACSQLNAVNTVACSYSTNSSENFNIVSAQVGEFYIIMTSNISGIEGTTTIQQTGGVGSYDQFRNFNLTGVLDLVNCDTLGSGISTFNLTDNEAQIANTEDPADYNFTYFLDAALTNQILNPFAYQNINPFSETIYVSIQHTIFASCTETVDFNIRVIGFATQPEDYNICDDDNDSDDTNGFHEFNLRSLDAEVLGGSASSNFTIEYYETESNAQNNISPIPSPTNFVNTTVDEQEIFIRIQNNADPTCFDITSVMIYVRPLPVINDVINFVQCDDDTDGVGIVNLTDIDELISLQTDLTYRYYNTEANAIADIAEIPTTQTINLNQQFFCRVESIYECIRVSEINVSISTSQVPNDFLFTFVECADTEDDDDDQNGINTFNLGAAITAIRNLFPSESNLDVTLYETFNDAVLETNIIGNPFEYRNLVPIGHDLAQPVVQDIWVRVENVLNDTCLGLGMHIQLTVNPLPEFNLIYQDLICIGEMNTISTDFDNTLGDFTFNWIKTDLTADPIFLSDEPFINIEEGGTYELVITNITTDCNRTEAFEVLESEEARIIQIKTSTFNRIDNQAIIEVEGIGDYEFSLDNTVFYLNEDDREFQDSNLFENLAAGEYEVTVRDKNLCGVVKTSFIILNVKPFFTPNGDSENQLWKVNGMELYPDSTLTIFDRFGKIMTQLDPNSEGWDGVYKGKIMNDSDYWFRFEYTNDNGKKYIKNGHFALITSK